MKTKYLLILSLFFIFSSCGKDKENLSFSEKYDQLIILYADLDDISEMSGISESDLVKMRFGIKSVPDEVDEAIENILNAYKNNDSSKLKEYKDSREELKISSSEKKIDRGKFSEIITDQIDGFSELRTDIFSGYLGNNIDSIFQEKFTLLTIIPNTWNYFTKNEEEYISNFIEDINTRQLLSESEDYYIRRVNAYKNSLALENKILFGDEISIPDFKTIPNDEEVDLDSQVNELIIDRTKSQIKEIIWDIFLDLIISLIAGFVISKIVNSLIDEARDRAINKFIENVGGISGGSRWKRIAKQALYAFGCREEYKEEVAQIKAKYDTIEKIVDVITPVATFILGWIILIKPQISMENEFSERLTDNVIESSTTLNIDPTNVIQRYISSLSGANETLETATDAPDEAEAVTSDLRLSGEVGVYPVVFFLTFDGDKVSGKYAYKKILSRYGNGPQSYMYLTGYVTSDNMLELVSRAYKKNEDLERISLPLTSTDPGSFVSGELRNVNTGEVLPLELRVE